jgi:hypothetical protein
MEMLQGQSQWLINLQGLANIGDKFMSINARLPISALDYFTVTINA